MDIMYLLVLSVVIFCNRLGLLVALNHRQFEIGSDWPEHH